MGEKKSPENTKNHQNVHVLHSNSEVSMSTYIALYFWALPRNPSGKVHF